MDVAMTASTSPGSSRDGGDPWRQFATHRIGEMRQARVPFPGEARCSRRALGQCLPSRQVGREREVGRRAGEVGSGEAMGREWGVVRRMRSGGGDRGSGTVWVVGFAVVIWVVGVAAILVGGVRGARHRGEAAADMAALAGAARVDDGGGAACARAGEIAVGSGARVVRCRVRGEVVDVSVVVEVPMLMGLKGRRIVSRARAGPVEPDGVPWRHMPRCTECQ